MKIFRLLTTFFVLCSSSAITWAAEVMPVFKKNSTVLFQGDSITDGLRRTDNESLAMGQSYAFIIAARLGAQIPERGIKFYNRGVSGNKVSHLASRWQTDALDLKPDLLSILVGINDFHGQVAIGEFSAGYEKLLSDTVKALPHVKLVIVVPFALFMQNPSPYRPSVPGWEADLKARQDIVRKFAVKYKAALVDIQPQLDKKIQDAPDNHWITDGIHLSAAGNGLLAEEWLRAVNKRYNSGIN